MKVICRIYNFFVVIPPPPPPPSSCHAVLYFSLETFYKRLDDFVCLDKLIESSLYPTKSADVENFDEKPIILLLID